jgi:hypothetical protein
MKDLHGLGSRMRRARSKKAKDTLYHLLTVLFIVDLSLEELKLKMMNFLIKKEGIEDRRFHMKAVFFLARFYTFIFSNLNYY